MWFPTRCDCPEAVDHDREQDLARASEIKAQIEAARRARERERIDVLIQRSGLGRKFLGRKLETFQVREDSQAALSAARSFVRNWQVCLETGKGLYLVGSIGAGKTHLAAGIANALLTQGVPVICKTVADMLRDIRRTFDESSVLTEEAVTEAYRGVDLLVADDLGKEPVTDWGVATLYSIINERYERLLPIVATTNYRDEDLVRRLAYRGDSTTGEAIVSRLHEMCVGVEMWLSDYRSEGSWQS
jgi:DNA replication protein DnaC